MSSTFGLVQSALFSGNRILREIPLIRCSLRGPVSKVTKCDLTFNISSSTCNYTSYGCPVGDKSPSMCNQFVWWLNKVDKKACTGWFWRWKVFVNVSSFHIPRGEAQQCEPTKHSGENHWNETECGEKDLLRQLSSRVNNASSFLL